MRRYRDYDIELEEQNKALRRKVQELEKQISKLRKQAQSNKMIYADVFSEDISVTEMPKQSKKQEKRQMCSECGSYGVDTMTLGTLSEFKTFLICRDCGKRKRIQTISRDDV